VRPYKVLVTHEVLSLPRPSTRDRQRIFSFLESLADNPFQKGDYEENDDVGRPIQIKVIGQHALTFWADHGSSEVKVTRIEKADRR
jgi:hypothetical protein